MKITLQLAGLHCGHCVKSVENALNNLPNVSSVQLDLATQIAVVEGTELPNTLIETIEGLGFDAAIK
ncbi:hypothetical protein A6B43_06195 [Vespertiliibacter pulmonis]|uniref:Copper chaperone n=1 Tax=Vespertiliibacter pulmonis TaxID=1443036 RepID=A0A3N4W2S8_9PAST|nr:heavy metal-associated domain-containing protein [Vespertiliibacter pulmonis]QLB21139.1 hypothetical protein A6B43_06195 [Vespertiliibacter pulmonis]RPE83757.1 copper chaperone [Vespertiliibacter pulmonis]